MKNKYKYLVLTYQFKEDLIKDVQKYLELGGKLQGGISMSMMEYKFYYSQAILIPKSVLKNEK